MLLKTIVTAPIFFGVYLINNQYVMRYFMIMGVWQDGSFSLLFPLNQKLLEKLIPNSL
jgi:hypothetical protein